MVTCGKRSEVLEAKSDEIHEQIMTAWATSNLVLFTTRGAGTTRHSAACLSTRAFETLGSKTIAFIVDSENFATVAGEIAIKYGVLRDAIQYGGDGNLILHLQEP